MIEFLNMGGYAAFVWPAYFFTLGLTFFLYKRSVKQLIKAEKTAKDLGLVEEKSKEIVLDQKQSA
jgi:heme exporter protein D